MKFIPFSQLKKLAAKSPGIVEGDDFQFSYSEFINVHRESIQKMMKNLDVDLDEALYCSYVDMVKRGYVHEHRDKIVFAGQGSSRASFAVDGGQCLKIALSNAGIAQNKVEYENTGVESPYLCFARNYAHADDWTSMVVECCSSIKTAESKSYLRAMYGTSDFVYVMSEWVLPYVVQECGCNLLLGKQSLGDVLDLGSMADGSRCQQEDYDDLHHAIDIVDMMASVKHSGSNDPLAKTLYDIVRFYCDHGFNDNCMAIDDLASEENWGMAVRDGIVVPVIVDAGFSNDVRRRFY